MEHVEPVECPSCATKYVLVGERVPSSFKSKNWMINEQSRG